MLSIEERFAVDGRPCSPQDIVHWVERLRPVVAQMDQEANSQATGGPTFFELATAIALLHFQARDTDFTILEVGLGGRLDSTNVCHPRVSVITSISFDHMRQLGNSLAAIAGEKAGIIKRGVPVITGVTQDEPWQVIQQIAQQHDAPLRRLGRDFDFTYHAPEAAEVTDAPRMDYCHLRDGSRESVAQHVTLSALGAHQAANAALAWATCESLTEQGVAIGEAAIRQGLSTGRCPARIEVLRRRPTVVIDTAHNAASIEALAARPPREFSGTAADFDSRRNSGQGRGRHVARVGPRIRRDRLHSVSEESARHARRRIVAPRATDCHGRRLCGGPARLPVSADGVAPSARRTAAPGLICATGSFFLAAEIKELLIAPSSAATRNAGRVRRSRRNKPVGRALR